MVIKTFLEFIFIYCVAVITFITITSFDTTDIKESYRVSGIVHKINDGDTLTISVTKTVNVRILDCWAPELSEVNGPQSKEALEKLVPVGSKVTLDVPIHENISKSFSFGRVLGRVYNDAGVNVGEEMVRQEMARIKK